MEAKGCDGHSALVLQFWYHLLDDLIGAGFLTGQRGFCSTISACQYGTCSPLDEGYLAAQPSYSFLPFHTTFVFVWTGRKLHAVFSTEKNELDLGSNKGWGGPDGQ